MRKWFFHSLPLQARQTDILQIFSRQDILKTDPTQITGLTLINKALEFESMTPDKSEWTLHKQKDNPPRLVRLQQLNVLLNVFITETFNTNDIASRLDSLFKGQFIMLRDSNKYDNLFKLMDKVIASSNNRLKKLNEWRLDELQHNYIDIIKFKKIVNKASTHNSGIMEISYPYFYSVILTDKISSKLDTKEIDDFLSLVIDPFGRTITKEKLIQDYNYPVDDVYDIDLEWW
ncbi:MAG: hypothetical protein IPO21_17370 [Bacteroidales bacterium]|nr:hypothetical protein [Bacteroidales bacterium]